MYYLQLIWKHLFKSSQRDHGTLGHLLTRLGRLPNAKVPKKDMHACEDALQTIFKGHMVAAACLEIGFEVPNDDVQTADKNVLLTQVSQSIVKKFTVISDAILGKDVDDSTDGVHNYTRVFCHFASLAALFHDAWKEGDGPRIIAYWKIFMLHFHASRKTKYALEALHLQFQLKTLHPYLVHQLTWGRFINTHGGKGRNIPCDLHNEHINGLFKDIVCNMGSNFTQEASTRAARSVTSLERISKMFDSSTGIHPEASAHGRKSDKADVNIVADIVKRSSLLKCVEGRCHLNFPKFSANPLHRLKRDALKKWITTKAKQHAKFVVTNELDSDDEEEEDEEEEEEEDDR